MKKGGSFIFWLCAFGAVVLAAQQATHFFAVSADTTPASFAKDMGSEIAVKPSPLAETAGQLFGALDADITTTTGPLRVAQTADRMQALYTARLEKWAQARAEGGGIWASAFGGLDTLSRVFRYDFPGGALVGVVREPEGFERPDFETRLMSAEATDMMSVTMIHESAVGSHLTTYRFDGRKLPQALEPARADAAENGLAEANAMQLLFENEAGKSDI